MTSSRHKIAALLGMCLVVGAACTSQAPTATVTASPSPAPTGTPAAPTFAASLVFTAAGDYGWTDRTTATLEGISRSGSEVHLALGDLSYSKKPEVEWCAYVRGIVGEELPIQVVAGNHEEDGAGDGHISRFRECLPDRMGSTGAYGAEYYFEVGQLARFIIIAPDLTIDGKHYFYGESNEHEDWLTDAIDGAHDAGIQWVIVGMHKSCLSVGEYYCNLYQELLTLLVEKKVDLVLHGHDHVYQRSRQLSEGSGCAAVVIDEFDRDCVTEEGEDGVYAKDKGPIFVTVGTAGVDLYPIHRDDPEAGYIATFSGRNSDPRWGFLKVEIALDELRAEFVGVTSGSEFTDSFRIRADPP
ncbi:MAG: metallophosphoesterase [Chloroflexi bacterium]|nr:metallophosphoesterase [Chloroflexota bacterium]